MNKWGWILTIAAQGLFLAPALSAIDSGLDPSVVLDSLEGDAQFGSDSAEQKRCRHRHHHHHHHSSSSSSVGATGATGPAGATGATGATGAGVAAVFGSYYNENGQTTSDPEGEPVEFPFDQVTPVGGIIHPVAADTTQFQLPNAGTYFVAWSVNYFSDFINGDEVEINLFNVTTATEFVPTTGRNFTGQFIDHTLTGQMFITVPAGTVITLRIANSGSDSGGELTLFQPSILIQQIN